MSGDLQIAGFFDVHSSDGTVSAACGRIDTQNVIPYLEAFRYAMNYTRHAGYNVLKIGYTIQDTCDSSEAIKTAMKDTIKRQYGDNIFGVVGPSNSDAAMEISQVIIAFLVRLAFTIASGMFTLGKCAVLWQDTISTMEDVVLCKIFSTVEDFQYC